MFQCFRVVNMLKNDLVSANQRPEWHADLLLAINNHRLLKVLEPSLWGSSQLIYSNDVDWKVALNQISNQMGDLDTGMSSAVVHALTAFWVTLTVLSDLTQSQQQRQTLQFGRVVCCMSLCWLELMFDWQRSPSYFGFVSVFYFTCARRWNKTLLSVLVRSKTIFISALFYIVRATLLTYLLSVSYQMLELCASQIVKNWLQVETKDCNSDYRLFYCLFSTKHGVWSGAMTDYDTAYSAGPD